MPRNFLGRAVPVFAGLWLLCGAVSPLASSGRKNAPLQRIAFGSCNNQRLPQAHWRTILAARPDLWIWLGDNIYADTQDPGVMREEYRRLKDHPDYGALRKSCPVIALWDDHDYGQEDGGKSYSMKRESQRLFLDFLDEPADSPRRKQEGVYASHVFGPPGKRVKVLLLDVRTFRDPPGPEADVLGEEQWRWLEGELAAGEAEIHIIASGSQILPEEQPFEKWADYPRARRRLLDLVARNHVKGVILLSGDRHFAEISRLEDEAVGYPLYEVTSSGLTHSWKTLQQEPNRYREGPFFTDWNFGFMEILWRENPVRLRLQVRDMENRIQLQKELRLPDLTPSN